MFLQQFALQLRRAGDKTKASGQRRRSRLLGLPQALLHRIGGAAHVQGVHQAKAPVGVQIDPAHLAQPAAARLRSQASVGWDLSLIHI